MVGSPVEIEMVKRRVQTRLERKRTGPEEWLVVTRHPLADEQHVGGAGLAGCHRAGRSLSLSLLPDADAGGRRSSWRSRRWGNWRGSSKRACALKPAFKRGKGEAGMDEYQVRTWEGWHHHMALSLIAVWFLIGETHRGQQLTPALTLPQVRYGLSLLLLEVFCTPGMTLICRQVHRQLMRNELARFYHHRTRKCLPPRKLRRDIQ